jgi:hypothetical protein
MDAGTDPGFVEPASYTILGALFREKIITMNKNLCTRLNVFLE